MENANNKPSIISPKEFLKKRRPERFSDSIRKDIGKLDRSLLEFQLSTLNKRNLEFAFEGFAKQLCEKIICPNLLEQTGPVAGGDGKVDTQTFPVSEQAKLRWYVGVNENSDKDRWAFAVSTQEDWQSKCRNDIRKIKATERDYKKAFFITNMYAKSNQRSELEDALCKETGIDVRILDVSWILDQIFKNGYEQLAIDTLSIEVDWRREIEIGANDYSKNIRIQELGKIIAEEMDVTNILPHQLDALLEIAVLSKEIEKPRIEIQGLFDRAISAANKFGTLYHQFNAHYQYAWASYWWFEDMILFGGQLTLTMGFAKKIGQSGQWGDVVSLLGLYSGYCRNPENRDFINLELLISETKNILHDLSTQDDRPSNSLMSRAYLELLNLQSIENIDQASNVFSSLLAVVKEGDRLVGFSFGELYDLVTELDSVFNGIESYEALLDYFTTQSSHRDGEVKAALLWLKRGARRLDSGEPYQAIKLIGKSLVGLYKKEVKQDLYTALNLLSNAYQKVGLLWASRANLLWAASMATDEFWRSGDVVAAQAYVYVRLAISELQLGRINYCLAWWNLACVIAEKLDEEVISENDRQSFDAFLSQVFLNANIKNLDFILRLPDLLDRYNLFVSRSMLLYVLGYEDVVKEEYCVDIDSDYVNYLKLVRDVDIGLSALEIINCDERYGNLKSTVMGCEINISFPFRSPLVELAETILSVIEAFFSTNMVDRVMVIEPRLNIEITAEDGDDICVSHELDDSAAVLKMEVFCSSFTSSRLNVDGQEIIQKWLHRFIIEIFAYLMRPKNLEKTLESMIGEDRAMERSVSFGACFVGLQNIMGNDAVKNIKNLLCDKELKAYKLLRDQPWDVKFPKVMGGEKILTECKSGVGEPPDDLINMEMVTHKDLKIQSLIKIRLWDKTVWKGVGFAMHSNGTPELTLLYEDEGAARAIFDDLKNELGSEDKANRLRISVIRNIDTKSPSHYTVCISENIVMSKAKTFQMAARIQTMTPNSRESIENFLAAYKNAGKYVFSYAGIKDGKIVERSSDARIEILKFDINVMDAWEVGPNDLEMMAIRVENDPFIPDGVLNPPIIETLKKKRGF